MKIVIIAVLLALAGTGQSQAAERLNVRDAKAAIKADTDADSVRNCRRIHSKRIACTAHVKDAGEIINEDTGEVISTFSLDFRLVAFVVDGEICVDWPAFESDEERHERLRWSKAAHYG
jgi:hypothetical protein